MFDIISTAVVSFLNNQAGEGALPIQIGVGGIGLILSAGSGAVAGVAATVVSHPADLIITKVSAKSSNAPSTDEPGSAGMTEDWRSVVKDMIDQEGGVANLFVGLPARASFFFLVIGLQFFLYDYVKGIFQVSSDDLSLVLDVFYSVRAGLAAST